MLGSPTKTIRIAEVFLKELLVAGALEEYTRPHASDNHREDAGKALAARNQSLLQMMLPTMSVEGLQALRVKLTSYEVVMATIQGSMFEDLVVTGPCDCAEETVKIEENFVLLMAHLSAMQQPLTTRSELIVTLLMSEMVSVAVHATAASPFHAHAIGVSASETAAVINAAAVSEGIFSFQTYTVGAPFEGDNCICCALLPSEWESFDSEIRNSYMPGQEPDFAHRTWFASGAHYASVESDGKVAYGVASPGTIIPPSSETASLAARLAWARIFAHKHTLLDSPWRVLHKMDPRNYPPTTDYA